MHRLSQYLNYISKKKAALFIGAGVSAIAGCAGLRDICRKLQKMNTLREEYESQSLDYISPREFVAFCKTKVETEKDKQEFRGIMRQSLTPDWEKFQREYVPLIKKIKSIKPSPPIITTNVDDALKNTREFNMERIFYKLSDMTINNFQEGGIFHLHGYAEDVENQVWDIFEYEERYAKQEFKDFLLEVFKKYSILYLGYALDDPELRQQMANAKKECKSCPIHFALFSVNDFPPHINEGIYEQLYNIKVIKYGIRNDFIRIFGDWLDSNYGDPVGSIEKSMLMPQS
ncbi:MAG: SIR2 family protein [Deltaproteobacteria bacterium]|nr:SIR2 family protein [Deltaproteobacteria bacterium]